MDDDNCFDYNELIDDYINDSINQSTSDYNYEYEQQRYYEEFEENDEGKDDDKQQQQQNQQTPLEGNVQEDDIVVVPVSTMQIDENNPTTVFNSNTTLNANTVLSNSNALRRRLEEIENRFYGGNKRTVTGNKIDRYVLKN
jgi:hypothetical protein